MTVTSIVGRRKESTLVRFRADPSSFLREIVDQSGPVVKFKISRHTLHLLKDVELIEELLVKKQSSFQKGPGMRRLRPIIGDGLLTIDSRRHMDARLRLQPAFSFLKIAEYARNIPHLVDDMTSEWASNSTVELSSEMARLTLAIIAATVFNSTERPDQVKVGSAIAHNLDALFRPLSREHSPAARSGVSLPDLDDVLNLVVAGNTPTASGDDLLSLLNAGSFTESERHDEMLTFLLGGHESVGVSLTWTWYALAQHPEIRDAFEHEADGFNPNKHTVRDLPLTRQIVAESLRLFPPAWMFSREASEEVEIGGVTYPSKSIFVVAPIVTHRDPRYWRDPEAFNPARWNPDQRTLSATPRFSFFPFGGGARRCIGEQFALTELPLMLAAIGKKWRLDLPIGAKLPEFDPVVTLRPLGAANMVLNRRR